MVQTEDRKLRVRADFKEPANLTDTSLPEISTDFRDEILAGEKGVRIARQKTSGISPSLPKDFPFRSENINVELFDKVMRKWTRGGVAPPIPAQRFLTLCKEYDMDPTLALAMAASESNVGTAPGRPMVTKNMFNVGNVDNGTNKPMSNWEVGLRVYLHTMTTAYGRRMEEIRPKFERQDRQGLYSSTPGYHEEIKSFVRQIRGDLRRR